MVINWKRERPGLRRKSGGRGEVGEAEMSREPKKSGGSIMALCSALAIVAALSGTVPGVGVAGAPAEAQTRGAVSVGASRHAGEFNVPLHKSQLLEVNAPFVELSVGNPDIADVVPVSDTEIYVLGKGRGTTNLTITGEDGAVLAVVDVVVTHDVGALKAKLWELLPTERIEVRPAGDSVVLSGQVSSTQALRQSLALAEQYAPDSVTNMMTVGGSQQVLLKVRFAEVARNTLESLGSNIALFGVDGDDVFGLTSGVGAAVNSFGQQISSITSGSYQLDILIDALEEKGMVRTLSEPNIIALSGDTANFLAGGEFPIPVAQTVDNGARTITVDFKQFGVGLAFTPTVIGRETINLELAAEVSSIDPTVSVINNDLVIPGLKVRRANTTVELNDGQSFAIAGLIQDNFQDTVRQLPGFGDIPVLGALFRSAEYERNQTELVVFITTYLVAPTNEAAIAEPTDNILPPTPFELFLLGKTYSEPSLDNAAGISGSYGYILP